MAHGGQDIPGFARPQPKPPIRTVLGDDGSSVNQDADGKVVRVEGPPSAAPPTPNVLLTLALFDSITLGDGAIVNATSTGNEVIDVGSGGSRIPLSATWHLSVTTGTINATITNLDDEDHTLVSFVAHVQQIGPSKRDVWSCSNVSLPAQSQVIIPFNTNSFTSGGPLLNVTSPEDPVVLADGVYAVSCYAVVI